MRSWRLDKDEHPMVAMHWERYFQHIVQKYNSIYKVQMPKVTPHVCRHTFCSRMAAARMSSKTLQYIMGHSDIGVTLNTYTHLGFDDALDEMTRISKDCHENEKNTLDKNRLKASKHAEIEVFY